MDRHGWTLRVLLQCTLFVVLVRPEEVFVSNEDYNQAFSSIISGARSSLHATPQWSNLSPQNDSTVNDEQLFVAIRKIDKTNLTTHIVNTTPPPLKTNFSCSDRAPGFYADVRANCKVYHTCDDYGNKFSYRCPEETAFRQDALICDHAHLVDCQATVYSEKRGEKLEKRDGSGFPSPAKFGSSDVDNTDRTFSRSFQVIRQPNKSAEKARTGFVFSSTVFLRDLSDAETTGKKSANFRKDGGRSASEKPAHSNRDTTNVRNDVVVTSSTALPSLDRVDFGAYAFNRFPNSRTQRVSVGNEEQRRSDSGSENGAFYARDRSYNDRGEEDRIFNGRNHYPSPYNTNQDPSSDDGNRDRSSAGRNGARSSTTFGATASRREEPAGRTNVFSGNTPNDRKAPSYPSYQTTRGPSRELSKMSSNSNGDYPYLETLRSIQANARPASIASNDTFPSYTTPRTTSTVTEIPVHALTLALKPLVPNELEYDPYYPRFPTSTEAYYTPSHGGKEKSQFRTSTQAPWSGIHFKIPPVLPDLNSLEDLVDRRKLFYIPRIRSDRSS